MEGAPSLRISDSAGRVRLGVDGFADVDGATLQEAADALVARLLVIAMLLRTGDVAPVYAAGCPDLEHVDFLFRLAEHASAGGDPRDLLFGPNPLAA
jgi:hypothetical protein